MGLNTETQRHRGIRGKDLVGAVVVPERSVWWTHSDFNAEVADEQRAQRENAVLRTAPRQECLGYITRVRMCGLHGCGAGGFGLLVGVVAGADKRAGFHVAEAHLEGLILQELELLRRVVP